MMDLLRRDTVTIRNHEFEIRELNARAMLELADAEPNEFVVIVVRHGVPELADEADPAAVLPSDVLAELGRAIMELSGMGDDGQKKDDDLSENVMAIDSSTG